MYEFSLPTKAEKVPTGSDWIHEIKRDGYGIDPSEISKASSVFNCRSR
jgi:hypothetical protein